MEIKFRVCGRHREVFPTEFEYCPLCGTKLTLFCENELPDQMTTLCGTWLILSEGLVKTVICMESGFLFDILERINKHIAGPFLVSAVNKSQDWTTLSNPNAEEGFSFGLIDNIFADYILRKYLELKYPNRKFELGGCVRYEDSFPDIFKVTKHEPMMTVKTKTLTKTKESNK